MTDKLQSRYLSVKSILKPADVASWLHKRYPDSTIVYATHDQDGVTHTHYVVRFASVTRWSEFRRWLMANDPHSYSASARSWPRSIRYLIHLDNPEKTQYPRESIKSIGLDDDELAQILRTSGADYENIFRALAETCNMQTGVQFLALVRRGFRPTEITAVARCLSELERFGQNPSVLKACSPSQSPTEQDEFEELACQSFESSCFVDFPM